MTGGVEEQRISECKIYRSDVSLLPGLSIANDHAQSARSSFSGGWSAIARSLMFPCFKSLGRAGLDILERSTGGRPDLSIGEVPP